MVEERTRAKPATGTLAQNRETLADDLLLGAEAIADFLFGDSGKRRQVYHLAQTNQLPIFKLGASLCARRSTLVTWIQAQEATKGAGS